MSLGVPYSYASSCGETSPVYLTSSADSSILGNLSPSWEVGSHFWDSRPELGYSSVGLAST